MGVDDEWRKGRWARRSVGRLEVYARANGSMLRSGTWRADQSRRGSQVLDAYKPCISFLRRPSNLTYPIGDSAWSFEPIESGESDPSRPPLLLNLKPPRIICLLPFERLLLEPNGGTWLLVSGGLSSRIGLRLVKIRLRIGIGIGIRARARSKMKG